MLRRRKLVAISMLGTTLDNVMNEQRWQRWRPTLSLCQQPELKIDRLELLYPRFAYPLAERITKDIEHASPHTAVRLHQHDHTDPWDFEEVYTKLDDFARGYRFDPDKEDYLVHITTGTHVAQICLFLLTQVRRFPAKLVQTGIDRPNKGSKTPADPRGHAKVIDLDLSRYNSLASRFAADVKSRVAGLKSGIDTRNAAFNALINDIEHVAAHSLDPLLLTGPTGAGKSQLARRIYELRHHLHLITGPLVEVNCATLRGDGAMSTLFGHRKGAFTGAAADRPGLLRAADGGMLFLDEIGELGLDEQAMLLRAIEHKTFLPLGADTEVSSSFTLIAGTNRDLSARVASGHFREDLLARINLWTFTLPSLADRREDIEPNLDYELEQFARRAQRAVRFNTEARSAYLDFALSPAATWPGNFRDLSASITRLCTLSFSGRISVETVQGEIQRLQRQWAFVHTAPNAVSTSSVAALRPRLAEHSASSATTSQSTFQHLPANLDDFDRVQLDHVITICRQSRSLSEAGRTLFAASRTKKAVRNDADRLKKYLARFDLTFEAL